MRQLVIVTLAGGLLLSASAAAEVRLRQEVRPSGDTLTMGDIFTGLHSRANIVVGPAPAPGGKATYKIKHIVALARQHQLAWQPSGDEAPVVVIREGRRFTQQDVLSRIHEALRSRGLGGTHEIEISGRQLDTSFERNAADLVLNGFDLDDRSGQFRAEVLLRAGNGKRESVPLSGRILTVRKIPMVLRLMRRGETVTQDDIVLTEVKLAPSVHGIVEDAADIVGKSARRALRPGQPLGVSDLTDPVVVEKGSLVTVTLRAPGLTLTTTGRALSDGSVGDALKVMNQQSKRTIETTVVGPGQAQVRLHRQLAVAANQ